MNTQTPRAEFLLRRLILLAGEVRDQLASGEWESAQAHQDAFDEAFASLQHLVEHGQVSLHDHANDVAQLQHVHDENIRLASELRASAAVELGRVANVRKLGGYAPLGANHRPIPQFLDGSA